MNPMEMLRLAWPFLRPVIVADLTARIKAHAVEQRVSLTAAQAGEVAEAIARYADSVISRA